VICEGVNKRWRIYKKNLRGCAVLPVGCCPDVVRYLEVRQINAQAD